MTVLLYRSVFSQHDTAMVATSQDTSIDLDLVSDLEVVSGQERGDPDAHDSARHAATQGLEFVSGPTWDLSPELVRSRSLH